MQFRIEMKKWVDDRVYIKTGQVSQVSSLGVKGTEINQGVGSIGIGWY
jgi:hypothetical protein